MSWETIYERVAWAAVRFSCEILLDSTGVGDVVLDELESRFWCGECRTTVPYSLSGGTVMCPSCHKPGHAFEVSGLNFSGKRKENLLTRLEQVLSYGQGWAGEDWGLLRMPRLRQVAEELTYYRLDDKGLDTDTVMSLALAAQALEFEETGAAYGSVHG